ncbi:ATP-binding protein [Phaeobacter sp. CNT1-3]|nr:ATP-binding protein [Phaeobacter sp. CNT1-3]
MQTSTNDGLDIPRQRLLWGVWSGLALAAVVSFVFVFQNLDRLNGLVGQDPLNLGEKELAVRQLELDLTGLQASLQLLEQSDTDRQIDERVQRATIAIVTGLLTELIAEIHPVIDAPDLSELLAIYPEAAPLIAAQREFVTSYGENTSGLTLLSDPAAIQQLSQDIRTMDALRGAFVVGVGQVELGRETQLQSGLTALSAELRRSSWGLGIGVSGVILVSLLMLVLLRRQRAALQLAAANSETILQASRDAVFLVARDMSIVRMGRNGETLFGYDADEVLGRSLFDMFASDRNEFDSFVSAIRESGVDAGVAEDLRIELNGRRRDGTTFPANARFSAVKNPEGAIAYVISVADMTEQVERELSLMQARNEALQAERAKSRFLAAMSHEMRTPLNGVLASLDLMRETTKLDERQAELARIIERSGDDALEQVENVLELTRLDALADTVIAVAPFSPSGQLRDIVAANQTRAAQQNNKLTFDSSIDDGVEVIGSAILFRQIMHNFVSNAVKFTNDGEINARLSAVDLGDELEFTAVIEDTGIGIEPGDLDRIFRNFETIRDSYSHFSSGTGLGLSIAKHSADLLNGKIEVSSLPGQGSSFALVVRWRKVAATSGAGADTRTASLKPGEMNVLVVEDNDINRQMLVDMLKAKGHTVVEAVDGLEGVAAGRDTAFDLILMDISMPKLDGVGATRMLRHMGKSSASPIVAVTAHSQPEHIREFLAAGMDRVLTKPLRMAVLDKLFEELTGQSRDCPTAETAPDVLQIEKTPCETDELMNSGDTALADKAAPAVEPTQIEDPEVESGMEEATMTEQLIDKEVFDGLIDMLGGESVVGYLAQFENDAVDMLPKYDAAIAAADFATARAEAHRCAGGAAVIGAGRVHEVLQSMTHSADDGDAAKSAALSATLLDLTRQTMTQMKAVIG